jgi:DNA polymerase-3 subunit delta'
LNAANALLKTLEEPPANSLLVLVTHRRARLPATIVSRCQQLAIAAPTPGAARSWLERELPASASTAALRIARGAPLLAAELVVRGFADLDRDMTEVMARLGRAALDVPAVADQWTRSGKADLPDRLLWLETWVTEAIIRGMTGSESAHPDAKTGLPAANETLKIRALYRVLDRLRQMKITSLTSLNLTMAIECLLLDLKASQAAAAVGQRSQGGRK